MRFFLTLCLTLFFLSSCGDRLPSAKTAHKVMTRHFRSYGKRYKESDFGKHPLEKVEIFDVREIQRGLVEAEGYAHFQEGPVYPVRVTIQKKPLGWRVLSWESLGPQTLSQ